MNSSPDPYSIKAIKQASLRALFAIALCSVALSAESFPARVVRIVDGDTFDVLRDTRQIRIRVASIDAPETGQPWATRARERTAALVFGKVVTLDVQGERRGNPAYQPRLIARVTLPDGKDLARELVIGGLAWHYKQYSSDLALATAEASARFSRRCLWEQPNPVPPWEWRHNPSTH